VSSLPKTGTRQRRDCDLKPGPSEPQSSTLTTRLPSRPRRIKAYSQHMTFLKSSSFSDLEFANSSVNWRVGIHNVEN